MLNNYTQNYQLHVTYILQRLYAMHVNAFPVLQSLKWADWELMCPSQKFHCFVPEILIKPLIIIIPFHSQTKGGSGGLRIMLSTFYSLPANFHSASDTSQLYSFRVMSFGRQKAHRELMNHSSIRKFMARFVMNRPSILALRKLGMLVSRKSLRLCLRNRWS